jgi:hypothetical protein
LALLKRIWEWAQMKLLLLEAINQGIFDIGALLNFILAFAKQ